MQLVALQIAAHLRGFAIAKCVSQHWQQAAGCARVRCRCDCKSPAFFCLSYAPASPSAPASVWLEQILAVPFWPLRKYVKPFACGVWRAKTKARSVARVVWGFFFGFFVACETHTHTHTHRERLVKLHNKRARKLPKRKLQFMPKTF